MITPYFSINQTDDFVEITVDAPYTHIRKEYEAEIHVDENELLFYSTPYYLRLTFDKALKQEGETFSFLDGKFTIKVFKKLPGEHFEELEKVADASDLREDVASSVTAPKYGFGNQKFGVLKELGDELCSVIDLEKPDEVSEAERTKLRHLHESHSFDESHYLADLHENDAIEELIDFSCFSDDEDADSLELEEEQKKELLQIPIERYIQPSDPEQKRIIYYGLIDILLAYAYDYRTTCGMHNIESGWTICKLSATLSWLDSFSDVLSVFRSFIRRSLCFPLYRNWELSLAIKRDVCQILKKGKKFILKSLLTIKGLLADEHGHHVLSQLYVDDYCIWIQHVKDEVLAKLANELRKAKVTKEELELDILLLEMAGEDAIKSSGQRVEETEDDGDSKEDECETIGRMESIGKHMEALNIEGSECSSDEEEEEEEDDEEEEDGAP